jgi:hypothetical protein
MAEAILEQNIEGSRIVHRAIVGNVFVGVGVVKRRYQFLHRLGLSIGFPKGPAQFAKLASIGDMSNTFFKEQVAPDHTSRAAKAIRRTPGHEHHVTGDDIAQPLAGDTETAKPQPRSSNGKGRLCIFVCGNPAAPASLYCEQCRFELDRARDTESR